MSTILIVDDNQQNLYMLQVLLTANGFQVVQASDGTEALERARREPPDIIVSDILMPVMDGYALCRAWKEDERLKNIPFVFYTATYTDPKDEDLALKLGADRFIVKPLEPDKFLALLLETLHQYEAGKPVVVPQPIEDAGYYKEYNAALIRKLEEKMLQLEKANRVLKHSIIELERAEVEREQLQEQMLQAQKMESVGRLAGGIAHDFNNMLSVILGSAELALLTLDPTHPLYATIKDIQLAALRSSELTQQLLAFARRQPVHRQILDLNDTMGGMLKILQRLIGEEIDLQWTPGAGLWSIEIDPTQIHQILANLCVNARDAITGVGQVVIETDNVTLTETFECRHDALEPGEYVRLTVEDCGCGMDDELLVHLFEPFFTTKGIGMGTGLGLATVYGIVQQNGGGLCVRSAPNQGTTFEIYFPRKAARAEPDRAPVHATSAHTGQETILLVEDEPQLIKLTCRMLEKLGYHVFCADTPDEAIRLADEHTGHIHLLLSDVMMPKMNGRDLFSVIQARHPHLKSLFMSGYAMDADGTGRSWEVGESFLPKPFSMDDLATKVREVLDREPGVYRETD